MNTFKPFNDNYIPQNNDVNNLNYLHSYPNINLILRQLINNHNLHIIDLKNKKLSLYKKNEYF